MSAFTPRRVVLDTNLIVAAGSRWLASEPPLPASPVQRLIHCVAVRHVGLYCERILEEYVELLHRRQHPAERIAIFVAYILSLFARVDLASTACHTAPDDPDDVVFILCALDGDADLLVSDDRHLLRVRDAYRPKPAILPPEEAEPHLFPSADAEAAVREGP